MKWIKRYRAWLESRRCLATFVMGRDDSEHFYGCPRGCVDDWFGCAARGGR